MPRIILGVTGSVAAVRTPALFAALRSAGHEVRVVATEPALYFFDPAELGARQGAQLLFRDADEWPGTRYQRGQPVLHIELRHWADFLVVAPLDANTLAKFALGLADNLLSCLFRAWSFAKPVVLAPAMNTVMWQSAVTLEHLRTLLEHQGIESPLDDLLLDEMPEAFARLAPGMVLVPPQTKRLACGDIGIGAMAEVTTIAEVVRSWNQEPSD